MVCSLWLRLLIRLKIAIITLGTPHQGSPLADWFAANKCKPVKSVYKEKPYIRDSRVDIEAKRFDQPIETGLFSLQTSSPEIKSLPTTQVPSHSIVGIAPDTSDTESLASRILTWVEGITIDDLLGGNGRHDVVVPTYSQIDGISGLAITTVNGVVHGIGGEPIERSIYAISSPDDIGEVESKEVWNHIISLLRTSAVTNRFGFFRPSLGSSTPALEYYTCASTLAESQQNNLSSASRLEQSAPLLPAPGTIFHPGDTIEIKLDIDPQEINGAVFYFGPQTRIIPSPPYLFSIKTPNDVAGRLKIEAFGIGRAGQQIEATTYIDVQPLASMITSISTAQDSLAFDGINKDSSDRILVQGQTIDDGQIFLSAGASGTKYKTRSGTDSIVAVDVDGYIRPQGAGTEVIEISNSGKMATVTVTIDTGQSRPKIESIAPLSIPAGSGTFTMTIKGENFTEQTLVYLNNKVLSTLYVSPTELKTEILAFHISVPQALSIVVGNNGGADEKAIIVARPEISPSPRRKPTTRQGSVRRTISP